MVQIGGDTDITIDDVGVYPPGINATHELRIQVRLPCLDSSLIELNWCSEGSSHESYTTVTLGIRNKLTDKLGLRTEVVYRRAFPFESQYKRGESLTDIGLSFRF